MSAALAAGPWLPIAVLLAGFITLLVAIKAYAVAAAPHPELLRKMLHVGAGSMTLSFPLLFSDVWPVVLLTTITAAIIALIKFQPWCRRTFGAVVNGVDRRTLGELYFPLAVGVVFWLSHGQSPLLFVVPVLVLTVADAGGALAGMCFGATFYRGGMKSLEGSMAFMLLGFLCVFMPLSIWSGVTPIEALLIAVGLAVVLTALEACARQGLDNLLVPLAAYFLLERLLIVRLDLLPSSVAAALPPWVAL